MQLPLGEFKQPLSRLPFGCRGDFCVDTSEVHLGAEIFPDTREFLFKEAPRKELSVRHAALPRIQIATIKSSGHVATVSDVFNITLMVPLRGNMTVINNYSRATASPNEFIIIPSGLRTNKASDSYLGVVVLIPHEMINYKKLFSIKNGQEIYVGSVRYCAEKPDLGPAILHQIISMIDAIESNEAIVNHRSIAVAAEDYLARMVSEHFASLFCKNLTVSGLSREPDYVSAAVKIIQTRISEPLKVTWLADEVCIGVRTLQNAFIRYRGESPTSYIATHRLERLHDRLLRASTRDSVTSIMLDCGIANFGRWAGKYKRRFGELPNQTLERSPLAVR